jgi:hypothetical protein
MRASPEAEGTTSLPTPLDGELTVSRPTGDSGWRVACEITPATHRDGEQMLDGLVRSDAPVCHLDLSAVTFADVAGVWPKLHGIEVVS